MRFRLSWTKEQLLNGRRDIRLLLANIDSAFIPSDKMLMEATKAAAAELHDAGLVLTITRGRMSMPIEPLDLQGPLADFNDGVFVNSHLH